MTTYVAKLDKAKLTQLSYGRLGNFGRDVQLNERHLLRAEEGRFGHAARSADGSVAVELSDVFLLLKGIKSSLTIV